MALKRPIPASRGAEPNRMRLLTPFRSAEKGASLVLLLQFMAMLRGQCKSVNFPELLDLFERLPGKRRFAFNSMQHDSLNQIAEREVFQFGNRFQDFQDPLFHSDAGLYPFDFNHTVSVLVPIYHGTRENANQTARRRGSWIFRKLL